MALAWQDAVFRIDSEGEASHAFGSAFVCHRERNRTYLLICNHVIEAIGEAQARIRQLPIEVVARGDDTLDLSLIAVAGLIDCPVLSLSNAGESGQPFVVYGYTWADPNDKKSGKSLARPLEGRLGPNTTFTSDQWPKVPAWDLPFDENNKFAELLDGYSGSPVWDPHNESVIAVVSHRRGKKMGYAIAVSNLLKLYPQAVAFFQPTQSTLHNTPSEMNERNSSATPMRIFDSIRPKDREQKGRKSQANLSKPRVFISYSHDSPEHGKRVLGLSQRLRKDGVETMIDQYVSGTPREGWPRWMMNQVDQAKFVLLICTETYYRRFRGHEESGKGKGADWEGAVITQEIYDSRSATTKFVPVLFDPKAESFIPEPVRSHTFYLLTSEEAYSKLYDFLLDQAGVEPCDVGTLKRRERRQSAPLMFPDENNGSQNPIDTYEVPLDSVAKPDRTAHHKSTIPQDPIDTLDEQGFLARIKKELIKSLSNERVQPLIPDLIGNSVRTSAELAVNTLLAMETVVSITRWTEITAAWFKELTPGERGLAWGPVRDVHLNLLPRLIDHGWITKWKAKSQNARDKRLLTISVKPSRRSKSPYRSVEVIVARVDAKCGTVRFYQADDAATVQAHSGQINTANEALRGMQKPTSEEAVQRVGRYLLAKFFPDDPPPDVLQADDWQELNTQIIYRPAGGLHYYYMVIPEDDPDYGNDAVLQLLYERMPNLPRILLSTRSGTNPLICAQYTLEAVIDAFWDIRRMEFA
jgi:hypothetical protein